MAGVCGVSFKTIIDIENRQTTPTINVLLAIAEGLQIPLSALLDGIE